MPRAFSLVGMLVTLACMLVLITIGMSSLNKAVTGEGSAVEGTVHSFEDQFVLFALHRSLYIGSEDYHGRFITPSVLTGGDGQEDVTANLFSAMVMQQYTAPAQLVSANEFSGYVDEMDDYDFTVYRPGDGVYWDSRFMADLADLSHVSFAHVPLFGERFERHWKGDLGATFPIVSNRGPKDGIHDPGSLTYGRNQTWGGHVLYGDGHTDFLHAFTAGNIFYERDGRRQADNIFALEDGPAGRDAILSFTRTMTEGGPVLQHD